MTNGCIIKMHAYVGKCGFLFFFSIFFILLFTCNIFEGIPYRYHGIRQCETI